MLRRRQNPAFAEKIQQLSLPLAPLVQITTGEVHPSFPRTLVSYHLLTSSELDSLAHFYHQRTPCEYTLAYPCPMGWRDNLTLEEKRRKLGKFIGLRGCESPIEIVAEDNIMQEARRKSEKEDEEEEMWRRKGKWY
jgi:hypothetical protein